MVESRFEPTKMFITFLLIFIAVQVGSVLYADYSGGQPMKLGWVLFLFFIVTILISLFTLGRKLGEVTKLSSGDWIFISIQLALIVLAFYYLPKFIPQIFSVHSIEISNQIQNLVNLIT